MQNRLLSLVLSLAMLFVPAMPLSAGAAEFAEPLGSAPEYVPGEVIVAFKETVNALRAASVIESADAVDSEPLDISAGGIVELVELPPGFSVEEAIDEFSQDPNVAYAQPNYIYYPLDDYEAGAAVEPNDPQTSNQWHLDSIKAYEAWGLITPNKTAVRVAVIDSASQTGHVDLSSNINNALKISFPGSQTYPAQSTTYPSTAADPHGTHVMGIIGAVSNNNTGIAGVATGGGNHVVEIIPIDVFTNGCMTTNLASAVDYSVRDGVNARVINLSLGGSGTVGQHDILLQRITDAAVNKGAVVVCAGGNVAAGNVAPFSNWPSDFNNVIGVVNLYNSNGAIGRHSSSNYPNTAEKALHYISAPGTYIMSTVPTDTYGYMTGTSMAAPVVAGVAAMMLYENPDLTPAKVLELLRSTATALDDKTATGGMVNAQAAVQAAKALVVQSLSGKVEITGGSNPPKFDETLVASTSDLPAAPGALTYIWKRGDDIVVGATASTYKLTEDDIGTTISVAVTAANYKGSIAAASPTAAVVKAAAPSISWPSVTNTVTYGQPLSAAVLSFTSNDYGTFAWDMPSMVPDVANSGYPVVFTPSVHTVNCYETISTTSRDVAPTVTAAPFAGVNRSISIINNGTAHNFDLTELLPGFPAPALPAVGYGTGISSGGNITIGSVSSHTLPITVSSDADTSVPETATITVDFTHQNYTISQATIYVTAIAKTVVDIAAGAVANNAYVYGDGKSYIGYTGSPTYTSINYTGTTAAGDAYAAGAPPTAAGSYAVTLTLNNDTHYGQKTLDFIIAKADPVPPPANLIAKYGNTLADVMFGTIQDGVFTWNDALDTSVGTVGTNNFDATYTRTDAAASNYNTKVVSLPVKVEKKTLTATGIAYSDRVYDGTTSVSLSPQIMMLDGVLPEDESHVGFTIVSATVNNKNAGDNKPVTAILSLSGDKAGNYSIANPEGLTVKIAKKPIAADDISLPTNPGKTYNGTDAASFAATFKPGAVAAGDSVTLMLTGSYDSAEAGTGKTITITGHSFSGPDAGNYEFTLPYPDPIMGTITQSGGGGGVGGGGGGGGSSPEDAKSAPATAGDDELPVVSAPPAPPTPWVNPFGDIRVGDWFYGDIEYAYTRGLMSGTGEDKFNPNGAVTREQTAAILLRCAQYAGFGPQGAWAARLDFADAGNISDWATQGAMFCYINGIIEGKPGKLFDPQGDATRAEAAAVLKRFIEAAG